VSEVLSSADRPPAQKRARDSAPLGRPKFALVGKYLCYFSNFCRYYLIKYMCQVF
jgi:hypothetical protein